MAKSNPPGGTQYLLAAATAANLSAADRAQALRRATSEIVKGDEQFDRVLGILKDTAQPEEVRLAALQSLQAATFKGNAFQPFQNKYVAALRGLTSDPSAEIQDRVIGILARAMDRPTQDKLLAGLTDPGKALVKPERALQLLSYDVHAGAGDAARKIVANPPNTAAKVEALRVLASDAKSIPLISKLLQDKNEALEVRQVCAIALQAIAPQKLRAYARKIVLDQNEDKDLKALSLTALTHFGDSKEIADDQELVDHVEKLTGEPKVKKIANLFLKKYNNR